MLSNEINIKQDTMLKNAYRLVRGMNDLDKKKAEKFDFIVKTASQLAQEFNFSHLTTPIVEYTNLFDRNLGAESDVVNKELYRFEDKSGDVLALRPEFTAGVCRYVIENGMFQGPFPHKFFSYGPVFRYDRPQKGRYRQFNQLNFEVFGLKEHSMEIYVYLKFIQQLLQKIGISDVVVKINYLGGKEEREKYTNVLFEYLQKYKSNLSADSQRRLRTNILRILDSKDEADEKILLNAPRIEDYLLPKNKEFLYTIQAKDDAFQIDNNLVRGLDYYSGFVFEVITNKIGATQDAVCGGGEYNNLVEQMCGKKLSAFGFALGIERLMEIMDEQVLPKKIPLYCHLTDKSKFIQNARNEINFDIDFIKGLKWANQLGADFVIFEKDGKLLQKDLATGQQSEVK